MSVSSSGTGSLPKPFPEISVDHRDPGQIARDRQLVRDQIKLLREAAHDAFDPDAVGRIQRRRRERGPRPGRKGRAVDFEVARPGGRETLLVNGELLIARSPNDPPLSPEVEALLAERNFTSVEPGHHELAPYLACFSGPNVRWSDQQQLIEKLRDLGVHASFSHVEPLQVGSPVVVKHAGNPFPTDQDLTFPDRQTAADANVLVAVIDTGITDEVRRDRWLSDVERQDAGDVDPLDDFPQEGLLDSSAGHGTFVAGIIKLVDPEARVRAYRALDTDGLSSEVLIAVAIVEAALEGAQIINLSLGGRSMDNEPLLAIEAAFRFLSDHRERTKSPLFVAAAGNFGGTEPVWPAALRREDVVAVAALTADEKPAPWSTHGDWVDCATIGEGIVSTYVKGTQDPEFGGTHMFCLGAWAVWTGTSFAAPQISGALSRICRRDDVEPQEAWRRLQKMGRPIDGFGPAMVLLPGTAPAARRPAADPTV